MDIIILKKERMATAMMQPYPDKNLKIIVIGHHFFNSERFILSVFFVKNSNFDTVVRYRLDSDLNLNFNFKFSYEEFKR